MKKLLCFGVILLLSSCGGVRSPDASFYSLVALEKSSKVINNNFANTKIGIGNVVLPSYLDRPQMVVREAGSTKMNILEYNRWAGDLSDNIQDVLAENLSSLFKDSIIRPVAFGEKGYKYVISIEIYRFDAFTDGRVELSLWWSVTYGKNMDKNISGLFKSHEKYDGTYDDMVAKQSKLLVEFSEYIVNQMNKI